MFDLENPISKQLVVGKLYKISYGIHQGIYKFNKVMWDGLCVFGPQEGQKHRFAFYANVEPYLFSMICQEIDVNDELNNQDHCVCEIKSVILHCKNKLKKITKLFQK